MKTLYNDYTRSFKSGWPFKHMWYDAWGKLEPPVSPFFASVFFISGIFVVALFIFTRLAA